MRHLNTVVLFLIALMAYYPTSMQAQKNDGKGIPNQLQEQGAITGRVSDSEENTPYANITIAVYESGNLVSIVQTDEQGAYKLMLPPAEYTISLLLGQGLKPTDEKLVTLKAGENMSVDFSVYPNELPAALLKSLDTYRSLKSYQDITVVEMNLEAPSDEPARHSFIFAYERPNQFRFEHLTDSSPGWPDQFCNGKEIVTYLKDLQQFRKKDAPEILTPIDVRNVPSKVVSKILVNDEALQNFTNGVIEVTEVGMEQLDGMDVTVLKMVQSISSIEPFMGQFSGIPNVTVPVSMWIGKEDHLIRKLSFELDMDHLIEKMPKEAWPTFSTFRGEKIKHVEIHTGIKANPVFSDQDFDFSPPEGAKLINRFRAPKTPPEKGNQ